MTVRNRLAHRSPSAPACAAHMPINAPAPSNSAATKIQTLLGFHRIGLVLRCCVAHRVRTYFMNILLTNSNMTDRLAVPRRVRASALTLARVRMRRRPPPSFPSTARPLSCMAGGAIMAGPGTRGTGSMFPARYSRASRPSRGLWCQPGSTWICPRPPQAHKRCHDMRLGNRARGG